MTCTIASELYTVDILSFYPLWELSGDGQVSNVLGIAYLSTSYVSGKAGSPWSQWSTLLGRNDVWNLLMNEQQFSECLD